MIPFITYREQSENGLEYYILQKAYPHINCKIATQPLKNFVEAVPLSSYNLWIVFDGCLRGRMIPNYADIDKEIIATMEEMASWFLSERILVEEKKYKKWKI